MMPRLTETQIDDLITAWYDGSKTTKLHQFLEWPWEDYCLWQQCPSHNPWMNDEAYWKALNKL